METKAALLPRKVAISFNKNLKHAHKMAAKFVGGGLSDQDVLALNAAQEKRERRAAKRAGVKK